MTLMRHVISRTQCIPIHFFVLLSMGKKNIRSGVADGLHIINMFSISNFPMELNEWRFNINNNNIIL